MEQAQYTWTVTAMDCRTKEGDNNNVVYNVHWTCSGQFIDFNASVYATCSVPAPKGSFTPYANLTQNQVLGWIYANGVDKHATEAAVAKKIQEMIAPTTQTPPLPWSSLPK